MRYDIVNITSAGVNHHHATDVTEVEHHDV